MKNVLVINLLLYINVLMLLQEELGHYNCKLSKHLKDCEYVNGELCNKLTMGFQDMDTKFAELYIDDYVCQKSTMKC